MRSVKKVPWHKSLLFILVHFSVVAVIWYPPTWTLVGICLLSYFVRMFAITAGYHRYFSHKTYKTNRIAQFLLALIGTTAVQKGVLWWAAHHRHHHRYSDTEKDIHSPVQTGFWYSHIGWILSNEHMETRFELIKDFAKFPELRWLNRHHLLVGVLYAVLFFALGGIPYLMWGFFISTVLLWHGTFTINSLSHVFGSRRYSTKDQSKNNPVLALITLGEGWHNNHHCYMSSCRQGFYWWEYDISYYLIKIASYFGVTKDIIEPPLAKLEKKRIQKPQVIDCLKKPHEV